MTIKVWDTTKGNTYADYVLDAYVYLTSDRNTGFCYSGCFGPYMNLMFRKYKKPFNGHLYSVTVLVCDMDDYWAGKEYMLDESNYQKIVHELLNWMKDMEFAFVHSDEPYSEEFFPSFGVEERMA